MRYSNRYPQPGKPGRPKHSSIIRAPACRRKQNSFDEHHVRQTTGCVGESPSWSRHRILIPAFQGSNPCSPAINKKRKEARRKAANTRLRKSRVLAAFHLFNVCNRHAGMFMALENLMVFTGNAIPDLALGVAQELGMPLGKAVVSKFSDGEIVVEINENVRGKDVFVLQSTCAPTNDNLMEIMLMVDALKRASAGRITAAIPYYGYARQDRRPRSARVAISAKVVANMLQEAGVERVLIMDLHADQIQGFFNIPVDNIYASPILLGDLTAKNYDNLLVVSPDVGGVVRARALAKRLDCDLAIIDRRRPKANVSEVMNIIGEVEGRNCVIMDDMVDTAGTLTKAAEVLKERGALNVIAYCTHPVLSGPALERITNSPLDELVVVDTIPLTPQARACAKIRHLSCASLLAETFRRISTGNSVLSLFVE